MHEVLVNRLGGLSLPRKRVVRLTDRPDMTLDVYRGRKTTKQQSCTVSSPMNGTGPSSAVCSASDSRVRGSVVVFVLLFYVHRTHLRSCRDGQLT